MRAIVQRSQESSVTVLGKVVGSIKSGLVVLVGFTQDDTIKDIEYIVDKIINLRIFDGTPELSVKDLNGEILAISQFTLYANAKKGRRPSYIEALKNTEAIELYNIFIDKLKESNLKIATGIFGADMEVSLINDGPITILLEKEEL